MRKTLRNTAGALGLFILLGGAVPAEAAELLELGNGADVSFTCEDGWNVATVHTIPTGQVLSNQGKADIEVTPAGIQYTYGVHGLALTFTPKGSFTPERIVPLPDNCWEVPVVIEQAEPTYALAPAVASDAAPEMTELAEKVWRSRIR